MRIARRVNAVDLPLQQDCQPDKLIRWVEFKEALNVTSALLPVLRVGGPKSLASGDSCNQRYRVGSDHRLQPRPDCFHVSTSPLVVGIDDD